MDYTRQKYVSPPIHVMLGVSLSQLAVRIRWAGKTFSEGVSWEKASGSIGRIGPAIGGGSCEDVDTWAMMDMCQKWRDVWFSCIFASYR